MKLGSSIWSHPLSHQNQSKILSKTLQNIPYFWKEFLEDKQSTTCTIVFGITDQLAEIHNETLLAASLRLCNMIPYPLGSYCKAAVRTLEPILTDEKLLELFTPDILCYALDLCYVDPGHSYCHLFPRPHNNFHKTVEQTKRVTSPYKHSWKEYVSRLKYDLCVLPGLQQICELLTEGWMEMAPAFDVDDDMFSIVQTARGSHWRGRDCRDWDEDSYPGRQAQDSDASADYNCNGIWGRDPASGRPWEDLLCANSGSRGLVVLGDSVSAHFHFPEVWMSPSEMTPETFQNYTGALLDELDWPHLGYVTGYENSTVPVLIQGKTDSIYWRLRAQNRCNHRDYQNICRNGASSDDIVQYVENIARNPVTSKPAIVFYAALGNDVCNSFADTIPHMTTPQRMRKNILHVLKVLNETLPLGSHVVLVGLVDGSFIFPTMAERLHPLGKLRGDIHYKDMYRWFTCMEIGPCVGWMTPNSTLRSISSQRAQKLNQILKTVAFSYKFKNFDIHYLNNPLHQVFEDWKRQGKPIWQLIDPIDSLHPHQKNLSWPWAVPKADEGKLVAHDPFPVPHFLPRDGLAVRGVGEPCGMQNWEPKRIQLELLWTDISHTQVAQPLIADVMWKDILQKFPHVLGNENPNNTEIERLFGNQGGH